MATESLLLTCLIDAVDNQDVATVDVPGAFMQSDMEGPNTHMKLEGKMLEILTKIDKNLYKICGERKKKICVYVKLKKSLYRTVQAALLF